MLPVVADAGAKPRDERPFVLQLTSDAAAVDFMQLGATERENSQAWGNLGPLPWYQPVSRLHPLATALAVHPVDKCVGRYDAAADHRHPAVRARGSHLFRIQRDLAAQAQIRRRSFTANCGGQMIHRLGLSHAAGEPEAIRRPHRSPAIPT